MGSKMIASVRIIVINFIPLSFGVIYVYLYSNAPVYLNSMQKGDSCLASMSTKYYANFFVLNTLLSWAQVYFLSQKSINYHVTTKGLIIISIPSIFFYMIVISDIIINCVF